MDIGRVYVIQNRRSSLIKIGKSKNVQKRKMALERACGEELEILYETIILDFAGQVEKKAHKIFKDDRRLGEWFNIVGFIAVQSVKTLVAQMKDDESNRGFRKKRRIQHREMERVESNIFFKYKTQMYITKIFKDGDLHKEQFETIEEARNFRDKNNY